MPFLGGHIDKKSPVCLGAINKISTEPTLIRGAFGLVLVWTEPTGDMLTRLFIKVKRQNFNPDTIILLLKCAVSAGFFFSS